MLKFCESKKKLKGYKFIDLFCGIGGFHLALSSLGAECVFASDINKKSCEVYKKNYNIMPYGDITKIYCKNIPSHDILCAGFPCQPFSISGNKKGFQDKNGQLFFHIIRIARYHKPKVIFLENVKNLQSHNNGETLKVIVSALDDIGYNVFVEELNASDYGIPQARKRLYIVAIRKKLKIKKFHFPTKHDKFACLSDIMLPNVDKKYYLTKQYSLSNTEPFPKSKNLLRIGSIGKGRQGERIYSVMGQGITLSSQGGGPGGKTGIYLVQDGIRILTPRECARMMGFPETFKMATLETDCYKQFGNSVVVNVIQEIAMEIALALEE